jgi:hypothetical protein
MAVIHNISKSKLADRVTRLLNAGKTLVENRVTTRDAQLAVAQARDQAILEAFMQRKAIGEHDMPFDFLVEKVITLEDKGRYSLGTLPTRGLSLLSHNAGIFLVTLEEDISKEIYPVTNSHLTMYVNQPALQMEGEMYYVPFQDKLKVYGVEKDGCKIIVQYVQSGEYFTENEFFCLPAELQDTVVAKAVQILSGQLGMEDPITDAKNP